MGQYAPVQTEDWPLSVLALRVLELLTEYTAFYLYCYGDYFLVAYFVHLKELDFPNGFHVQHLYRIL